MLSLCINTYNEEKNIPYPLESAYDLVDEVVIIDGSSSDKTIEVAKSYGEKVKVFVTDNPKNFITNKQRAIEKASGDWILQLDADEALSPELKKEIKVITGQPFEKDSPVGYWMPRKNWFLGRYLMKGGVYPDYVLRLYRKDKSRFVLDDIHENVVVMGKTAHTVDAVLHHADPNFERYLLRWNRYTTFEAENLHKKGKKLSFFGYFFCKPTWWFLKTYFRHKGFMDGFPGFVFSLFSSIRFWAIYVKWWKLTNSS